MGDNTRESLRLAARLAPTNGVAFARLAMRLFNETNRSASTTSEADWYARHAVDTSPEEAEAWLTRAKIFERSHKSAEALEVMNKASLRLPLNPAVWNAQGILLQRTKRWEEASRAFSKAIALTESGTNFRSVRAKALQSRSEVLEQQGRFEEARADLLRGKGIPPRDSHARANLMDLAPHYNGGLAENWRGLYENDDFSALSLGVQKLGGVDFDVRGVVQLSGQWLKRQGRRFPEQIDGIKLNQTCQQLHFLHAAGYLPGATNGTPIARYIVHFANGKQQDIPVIYGRDVLRHWIRSAPTNSSGGPVLAWRGSTGPTNAPAAGLWPALYRTTWSNPWPEVRIETLDFISAMTEVDAFLVAITTE